MGGTVASCWGAANFVAAIETVLTDADARATLSRISMSSAESGTNVYGIASVTYRHDGALRTVWFVSQFAVSLTTPGAELTFDPGTVEPEVARNLSLNGRFFERLVRAIALSLMSSAEPEGDGSEYDAVEAEQARRAAIGVTGSSRFLNVGIDTQVTWPKSELLVKFDKYHLVLMPKTKEHTQSVHIDLVGNQLTRRAANTVINRFLSTLAWCDDQFAIVEGGWAGNPIPVPVRKRDLAFATVHTWIFSRTILGEDKARRALALYREGLNAEAASLTSYAVLSFFKVIELGYRESERVKKWIGRGFQSIAQEAHADDVRMSAFLEDCRAASPEDYIWEACRLAVAHASLKSPSDADDAAEIRRLSVASYVLRLLARRFIRERYKISESPVSDVAEMSDTSSDGNRH
ncbi:hypothetical protein LMG24235_05096 [Paraburkholderia sabiae]|nr:hypothetical protein LMG24235_05096 [Paraburkholderia sabiae]